VSGRECCAYSPHRERGCHTATDKAARMCYAGRAVHEDAPPASVCLYPVIWIREGCGCVWCGPLRQKIMLRLRAGRTRGLTPHAFSKPWFSRTEVRTVLHVSWARAMPLPPLPLRPPPLKAKADGVFKISALLGESNEAKHPQIFCPCHT